MNNVKLIYLVRHGVRTSSTIGRKEDRILNPLRKGLTCVGKMQLFKLGQELCRRHKNKFAIHINNESRIIDSAKSLNKGITHINCNKSDISQCKETSFVYSPYKVEKFNPSQPYIDLLGKFPSIDYNANSGALNHSSCFLKIKSMPRKRERLEVITKSLTPYLKNLFLNDLHEGVYDFKTNRYVSDISYFNDSNFNSDHVKRILDFIKCNKMYEDIPIYNSDYKEAVTLMKEFLLEFYAEEDQNQKLQRVIGFLQFISSIDNKSNGTLDVFINHNTAIRSLISILLDQKQMKNLINNFHCDKNFFMLCPVFGGYHRFEIIDGSYLKIFQSDSEITSMCNKELMDINGISLSKLKSFCKLT